MEHKETKETQISHKTLGREMEKTRVHGRWCRLKSLLSGAKPTLSDKSRSTNSPLLPPPSDSFDHPKHFPRHEAKELLNALQQFVITTSVSRENLANSFQEMVVVKVPSADRDGKEVKDPRRERWRVASNRNCGAEERWKSASIQGLNVLSRWSSVTSLREGDSDFM